MSFKHLFLSAALICATTLSLGSCNSCSKSDDVKLADTAVVVSVKNFNTILQKDFKSVKDTSMNVVFYESQIILDEPITSNQLSVNSITNVMQDGEYSYQFIHKQNVDSVNKVHDYWLEDCAFNPDSIITLDSAITRLMMADIVKPQSKFIVLRKALGPTSYKENPGYIFGDTNHGPWIKVDAKNGAVTEIK